MISFPLINYNVRFQHCHCRLTSLEHLIEVLSTGLAFFERYLYLVDLTYGCYSDGIIYEYILVCSCYTGIPFSYYNYKKNNQKRLVLPQDPPLLKGSGPEPSYISCSVLSAVSGSSPLS